MMRVTTALVCICFILGVASQTAQKFQSSFVLNDPSILGTLTGTVFYSFPDSRVRFDYTIGVKEFFEFNATTINVKYTIGAGCTACNSETIQSSLFKPFREGADTVSAGSINIGGRACNGFNKVDQAGQVSVVFVDASGLPCRTVFSTGKTLDYLSPIAISGNPFAERPSNCPAPVCANVQDIMLMFHNSRTISAADQQAEIAFATSFAQLFAFGPQETQMGFIQIGSTARLTVPLIADQASYINQMKRVNLNSGLSCLGCGLRDSQEELLNSGRQRPNANKIAILLSNGFENFAQQLPYEVDLANIKKTNIHVAVIGVGDVNKTEAFRIGSSPNLVFFTPDFQGLSALLNNLSIATCFGIPGNPCGPGCQGFCSCNQNCLCPDTCGSGDQCSVAFCNVTQNGAGCQVRAKDCNDNNLCTTDSCNSATGCVHTSVTCNDNSLCTTDSCVPSAGCVFAAVDCNEADPCFTYSCDTATGCQKTKIQGQCACQDVVCPPIPCGFNRCDLQTTQCVFTPLVCNSGSKCIIDSCNNATSQCVQTPLNCDDGNACTIDSCDSATGCVHTPISCNDSSVCTEDTCDPAKGCVFTPLNFPPADNCQDVTCNSLLGPIDSPKDCGSVLNGIDPNKQGDCYIVGCAAASGCRLEQIPGTTIDQCGFCAAPGTQSPFCLLGLDQGQAAGLGAGVIAAIVIGAVVAAVVAVVSGKKGYDMWRKNREGISEAHNNPFYEGGKAYSDNPFFGDSK